MPHMRIIKIFNNNVVLTYQNTQEVIVVGNGIAFNKSVKDIIPSSKIEKIFTLQSDSHYSSMLSLLKEIPEEYFEISTQVINFAERILQRNFGSATLIALTDHVHFAVIRQEKNIPIKNDLLWEIKHVYPAEFSVGKHALEIIKKKLQVDLPEDEAGFIGFKFIENSDSSETSTSLNKEIKLVNDILTMAKYLLPQKKYQESSINYQRFVTHLRYLAARIYQSDKAEGNDDDNVQLLTAVSTTYSKAFSIAKKIKLFIQKQIKVTVSANELSYLTIHIQRLITE